MFQKGNKLGKNSLALKSGKSINYILLDEASSVNLLMQIGRWVAIQLMSTSAQSKCFRITKLVIGLIEFFFNFFFQFF